MASEWPITTIGDLAADDDGAIAIGPFGSSMKADVYTPTGVPVVRGNNLTGQPGFYGDLVFVPKEVAARFERCLVRPGDLVFPHRGAIGEVGLVTSQRFEEWMLSTSMMKLRPHPDKLDPHFAFYYFRSPAGRHQLLRNASQVGTPGISQPLTSLRACEITLPPLQEQRAIAAVLGALDDKIEQNRRTARALEGLARATFKAWFVDFEPVKAKAAGQTSFPGMPPAAFAALSNRLVDSHLGPVPEAWETKSLYSVAKFVNGAAFKSSHFCEPSSGLPIVKIAELKSGITDQTKYSNRTDLDTRYRIDTGDMLYSWSGSPDTSLDTFLWTKGPGLLNQHIFRVVTASDAEKVFVYYLLKHLKQDLIEIARDKQTTGLGHVTVGDMQRLIITWPDANCLAAFQKMVGPLFALSFNGMLESEKLAALRDYLLPRLLDGRLRMRGCESDMKINASKVLE